MTHQTETHESGRRRTTGILRSFMVVLWMLGLYIGVVPPADAQECAFPDNVNWVVDQSCEISVIRIAPRNLSVNNGAVLTIQSSGELILDMRNFRINVDPDSRIAVAPGGRIRSNQIGPLLVRRTDGGTFGYYLKRVNGAVLESINANFAFYPASTIKVLQHLYAMRQVDLGNVTLNGTVLIVCSGGTNCSNNANTSNNCGGATVNQSLSQALQNMMIPSNNQSTNAIQELFGNGTPSAGRAAMNQMALNTVGMSNATALQHKFACGNVSNNPFNTLTLADVGLLYEQVATNAAILFPATQPANFQLPATNFYQLMLNHTGDRFVDPVITSEAGNIGMSAPNRQAFRNLVRMAHKPGNIGNGYQSIAGWISLPVNGGANTQDFVYGFFVHNAATNTLPTIRTVANVLLRGVIREALEAR